MSSTLVCVMYNISSLVSDKESDQIDHRIRREAQAFGAPIRDKSVDVNGIVKFVIDVPVMSSSAFKNRMRSIPGVTATEETEPSGMLGTSRTVLALSLLISYSRTPDNEQIAKDWYDEMLANENNEDKVVQHLVSQVFDGLCYGNWIWVLRQPQTSMSERKTYKRAEQPGPRRPRRQQGPGKGV